MNVKSAAAILGLDQSNVIQKLKLIGAKKRIKGGWDISEKQLDMLRTIPKGGFKNTKAKDIEKLYRR